MYIILVIIILIIRLIDEKIKKNNNINKVPWINIIITSLLLSFYSALLGVDGGLVDRSRYVYAFLVRYKIYYTSLEAFINAKTEPGYLLLNFIIGLFTNNYFWLFFIITLIFSIINLYVLSRFSKKYTVCIFLFLSSLCFFQSLYLLRQSLAVAFGNLALLAYLKDQKIKFFIYSIIACTFHITAIILIIIIFVFKRKKSLKNYILITINFVIFFVVLGPLILTILSKIAYVNQFLNLENSLSTGFSGTITSVFKGIPFYYLTILAILKQKQLIRLNNKADFFITSSLLYSFSWLSTYSMYWFFRVGWFFLVPTLALVPMLFNTIKDNTEKIILFFIFVGLLLIITIRQISIIFY